jgi:hypothetical protein
MGGGAQLGKELFESLATVRWDIARRTYGNSHSTLIGLIVEWWIAGDPRHWALECGPAFAPSHDDPKCSRYVCDALFYCNDNSTGVLEVEGNRQEHTAAKFGDYFRCSKIKVDWGILLLYPCGAVGRGKDKGFPAAASPAALAEVKAASARNLLKDLFVIAVEKIWNHGLEGIRKNHPYYAGSISEITATWYRNGTTLSTATF